MCYTKNLIVDSSDTSFCAKCVIAGPTVFAAVKHGDGLDAIIGEIFAAQRRALAAAAEE